MKKIIRAFFIVCMIPMCAYGHDGVNSIDIVDKNGDTALCVAIKSENIDKYNSLKKAGANTEHECVKKIPAQQYEYFMRKVASNNKPWSFLGLGKWAWFAIGVGVATGVGVVAISGGDSSSNSSPENIPENPVDTCQYGYVFDGAVCIFDDVNYVEQDGHIYLKLNCGNGTQIGNTCTNNSDILIDNTSFPNTAAHGIWVSSNAASAINTVPGKIIIKNTYQSYGLRVSGAALNAVNHGKIYIDNTDLTNAIAYGIHVGAGASAINTETGEIRITNISGDSGYSAGIYAIDSIVTNSGLISMENTNGSFSIGILIGAYSQGVGGLTAINNGTINIKNAPIGTYHIGIHGSDSNFRDLIITNNGTITIENTSLPIGIDATNAIVTNNGTIAIDGATSSAIGIHATDSIVTNAGTIIITDSAFATGIYASGSSTIVRNTGTISINGNSCVGDECNGYSNNHIRLVNGATFVNSGSMMAPQMNLNSMGGNMVAGLGAQFVVENELSGDLNISSELVQNGNQTTYIAENMINAGDISGLNVYSTSAMFEASLADNGHDVVMQMKDFNELTDNKSLATFLRNNYTNGNGVELFRTLKSTDNMPVFNSALSGFTGLNTFSRFAHEDLSALREISFSMNTKLFENSNHDNLDVFDNIGYFSFSNSHNVDSGQYGISIDKISDNWKLGYGMAIANINTNGGDRFSRQNKMWLFYMPATYTNDVYELVVVPKAGFAHAEYNRRGYNGVNYDGYIEKRIFGLMNDLRYPLTFGNWTIAPDLAFNTIVYEQSGHEDESEFSLIIPDDRTVSVETGLGFYTKYEKAFSDGSKLKLNSGLMAYREFGDCYNIKLGIQGMDGTFNLYNNEYKYRGAASMGFDYIAGRLHLYGNAQYFMDNVDYMNFKGGVNYRF